MVQTRPIAYTRILKEGTATIVANNNYVTVAHGLSFTPDIDKIIPLPRDNLGGSNLWISDVDGTNFRINISSKDASNRTVGYIILR